VDSNNAPPSIVIAVYAALAYDIIAAINSSPQTTEINAASRAPTLMKWVHLGLLQVALFTLLGAAFDTRRWPPLVGGGLASALLYVQYVHAKNAGLESEEPGTESY
jgi:hypothetical protein